MKKLNIVKKTIEIPSELQSKLESKTLTINGPKGKNIKTLDLQGLKITLSSSKIELEGHLRELNTAKKHIKNMIDGSKDGYIRQMKIIHAHFPATLEIKNKKLIIKNFIGERKPRTANIVADTKVEIKGHNITITGPSKEDVTQTAANFRIATKISGRDSRIFQDGIYPVIN